MTTAPSAIHLRRSTRWILVTLAVLHGVLAFWGMRHTGVTNDETAHLTAGYAYWKFNDYRLQPENGNLPQRWAGLALLPFAPQLEIPADPLIWRLSDVWLISDRFFFASGNPIDQLLLIARIAMLAWPLALGALVFGWARRLWDETGAVLATACYAVSPTVLANGWLVNSDTTAAFWLLAACAAWWHTLHCRGWKPALLSVVVTGLAFIAKFSCVLLLPTFALLALLRLLRQRQDGARVLRLALAHALGIWLTIWLAFGLRYSPIGPEMPALDKYFLPWDLMLSVGGPFNSLIEFARHWRLLPEAFIEGFTHVRYQGHARDAFLFGDYRQTGWWWFFPATFLLKSTTAELLATLVLISATLHRLIRRRGRLLPAASAAWPLLAFGAVYGVFSLTSTLNIGHRHILPLYPILFIAIGGLPRLLTQTRRPVLWLLLPAASLVGTLGVAPHYLAFFNAPSGGPTTAWRKLVDSSLDWGQNLPALARWIERNRRPEEPIYLSYFGSDSPAYRLPEATLLSPYYDHYRPRTWVSLQPGLYCISATLLQDVYSPFRGPWTAGKEKAYHSARQRLLAEIARGERSNLIIDFGYRDTQELWDLDRLRFNRLTAYLKFRAPDALIGYGMFVYRLSAEELQVVTTGTSDELADLMEAATTRPPQP